MKEKNRKPTKNNSILYKFEQSFWDKNELICGIDEVGRGSLAGPIVTAAVILRPYAIHDQLKDSKLLSSLQIENICKWIREHSWYAIGISNARVIDVNNIYTTTQLTMKKALLHLLASTPHLPQTIAIDAMPLNLQTTPYAHIPIQSWTQGESKSASIAAASIIAKATRDNLMKNMDKYFPSYKLSAHKGYGTPQHIAALKAYRPCVIHRKTFIKNLQGKNHDQLQQQNLFF